MLNQPFLSEVLKMSSILLKFMSTRQPLDHWLRHFPGPRRGSVAPCYRITLFSDFANLWVNTTMETGSYLFLGLWNLVITGTCNYGNWLLPVFVTTETL